MSQATIKRVGVVVPAHNEQDLLPACLDSLELAVCRLRTMSIC